MHRKRLVWQLFPSYLLITLVALLAITLYAVSAIHGFYLDQLSDDLQSKGHLLAGELRARLSARDRPGLESWVKEHGKDALARITVILPPGKVIADSDHDPATMEDHGDRPEVLRAASGQVGRSFRYSPTIGKDMMYVAFPVDDGGKVAAILRLAVPVETIAGALHAIYARVALGGVAVALAATGISLLVSRRISRPLEEMKRGADRFAGGDLAWRLAIPETAETAALAERLNAMAEQLGERIQRLLEQRNEQQAVLSSMVEGVLAVDKEERILSMNQAGGKLLEVDPHEAEGRTIQEAVRNTDLQEFVARTLAGQEPVEGDIVLRDNGGRFLQAHGTILHDAHGRAIGAVIVLNDVTRLHRLETVRRDFVANVSHELKTPITSIKGFVETLLDGALKNPEDAERFLRIVARQTDRLNAIIEDILTLSRVEDQAAKSRIQLERGRIADILKSAVQLCELSAKAKNIAVKLDCDPSMTLPINAPLLEQAVVNLIDNAIKYSDAGGEITVTARGEGAEAVIAVQDRGCGIGEEHLPRIFERFYRVDKARSRTLGGTGLGLAIVKHIVLAHGGTVRVESAPGRGSTFFIRLPVNGS
jgi:two-component system, OmpR family, phosphate regulon sensor histidine kinase PhoR